MKERNCRGGILYFPFYFLITTLCAFFLSCNDVHDCPEYGYNNGWIEMQTVSNHTSQLLFIENCLANGPCIIFYESGVVKEYGTLKNGVEVGKWYHYNEVGELIAVTEHDTANQ